MTSLSMTLAFCALLIPAFGHVSDSVGRPSLGARVARVVAQSPTSQVPRVTVERLTLDDAIGRALQTSHRIAEAKAREAGAHAAVQGRQAAYFPQMSVLAGYTRTNHVPPFGIPFPPGSLAVIYPDIPDNYRSRFDVQWPIYTFGRIGALERVEVAEAEATANDSDTARADLKLDVTRAFWALVTARESVRVLEESLNRMDAALQDTQNRLKAGLVPPSDVMSVRAQRSRQQMLVIQARNRADLATADLARLAGLPPGTDVEPVATLNEQGAAVEAAEPNLEALIEQARQARPERQALAHRAAEAGARRDAAVATTRPTFAASAGVDYAQPNPRFFPRLPDFHKSWDASVNFSWSVWDAGRGAADVAQATANQRAVTERLAEFDSVLEVEVRQRWLDLASSRAAVAAASDAVEAAAEARRVLGERFANGVATSTDVLDAQVALLQAELDRTQALANVKLAEARLERALGK